MKFKVFRILLVLILVGPAVALFLLNIMTLQDALSIISTMPLWIVGLAALTEACSYIGGGYLLKVILSHEELQLSIRQGVLLTLAASSAGLIVGGWISSAATIYYWISHKKEEVPGEAALAGILPNFLIRSY